MYCHVIMRQLKSDHAFRAESVRREKCPGAFWELVPHGQPPSPSCLTLLSWVKGRKPSPVPRAKDWGKQHSNFVLLTLIGGACKSINFQTPPLRNSDEV